MESFKKKGIKIALDDAGAGANTLETIVELEPDFVKIDITLIRNINKNLFKQDLLRILMRLCNELGIQMIAEGIEAEGEYDYLLKQNISFGQGYLLGRPTAMPK